MGKNNKYNYCKVVTYGKKSGRYRLFVEGLEIGENIHVTSYVYIKNARFAVKAEGFYN